MLEAELSESRRAKDGITGASSGSITSLVRGAGAEEDLLNINVKGVLNRISFDASGVSDLASFLPLGIEIEGCVPSFGVRLVALTWLPESMVPSATVSCTCMSRYPPSDLTAFPPPVSQSYASTATSNSLPFFPATNKSAILAQRFSRLLSSFSASPLPFLLLLLGPSLTFARAFAPGLNLQSGYFFLCSA